MLGLLAGVLAMHGLAPGEVQGSHGAAQHHHAAPATTPTPETACPDGGGGHPRHADPACAAGAVSGGPVLPAPVPDPVPAVVRADAVRAYAAEAPDGARAPPSLAELQLLRI
ncbi:DUF6153 family protein [Streptomyces sp. NPDC051207]|uniref:DUF6153 family protein n=1 Tax=Streptomyces sp. NPDC051207 TaxID=3154641 RepID=UPI003425241B